MVLFGAVCVCVWCFRASSLVDVHGIKWFARATKSWVRSMSMELERSFDSVEPNLPDFERRIFYSVIVRVYYIDSVAF